MSVRKAFLWAIGGQVLAFAATFGTTVTLSRLLSPHEIGVYAISIAITGMLQAVASFGISAYLVSKQELDSGTLSTAFTINGLLSIVLCVSIFATSYLLTLSDPLVGTTLRLLSMTPLLATVEFLPAVMLQREMRFDLFTRLTIGRTIAGSLTSIAAAVLGAGALSPAYGALAFAGIGAIFFPMAARAHNSFRVSLHGWKGIFLFGIQSLSIGGVSLIGARLSEIILGRMLGLSALGIFTRASSISTILFQNLYGSAARVFMAQMAEEERQGKGLRTIYLRGLDIVLALMWPLLIGIAVLSGPAVNVLFGQRWLGAAMPLSVLMLVQAIGLSFAMSYELFVLRDQIRRQVPLEFVRTIVGVSGLAVGCLFGVTGAATGRLLDSLTGAWLFVPHMRRLSGSRPGELSHLFARNVALTIVAVLPSVAVMSLHGWRADAPLLHVGAAVVAGASLWAAMLRQQRHPLYNEALLILQRTGLLPLKDMTRGN
jgi:O-antigen/teichoic acid export membrane protein